MLLQLKMPKFKNQHQLLKLKLIQFQFQDFRLKEVQLKPSKPHTLTHLSQLVFTFHLQEISSQRKQNPQLPQPPLPPPQRLPNPCQKIKNTDTIKRESTTIKNTDITILTLQVALILQVNPTKKSIIIIKKIVIKKNQKKLRKHNQLQPKKKMILKKHQFKLSQLNLQLKKLLR